MKRLYKRIKNSVVVSWIRLQLHCLIHMHQSQSLIVGKYLFRHIPVGYDYIQLKCYQCNTVYYEKSVFVEGDSLTLNYKKGNVKGQHNV